MYSVQDVLSAVHAHPVEISVAAILVYLFGFAQYFTAVSLQLRDKKSPWYFWMHAWYIGHDLTFVSLYDLWFHQVDFWLFKVLWAGCVAFVFIELFVLYLTVKNERQEVFGRYCRGEVTPTRAWIRGLAGYALGIALFALIRTAIGDTMCLALMMSTNFIVAVVPAFLAEERGSREGHSMVLGVLVLLGTLFTYAPAGIGFWASAAPVFREPWYGILGAIAVAGALRYLWVLKSFPSRRRMPARAGL